MNRTPQEILAAAAKEAGLNYVSKAEAEAGVPVPENQKTWLQTLKDAIEAEEHAGTSKDVEAIDNQDKIVGNANAENVSEEVNQPEAELETA